MIDDVAKSISQSPSQSTTGQRRMYACAALSASCTTRWSCSLPAPTVNPVIPAVSPGLRASVTLDLTHVSASHSVAPPEPVQCTSHAPVLAPCPHRTRSCPRQLCTRSCSNKHTPLRPAPSPLRDRHHEPPCPPGSVRHPACTSRHADWSDWSSDSEDSCDDQEN